MGSKDRVGDNELPLSGFPHSDFYSSYSEFELFHSFRLFDLIVSSDNISNFYNRNTLATFFWQTGIEVCSSYIQKNQTTFPVLKNMYRTSSISRMSNGYKRFQCFLTIKVRERSISSLRF